MRHINRRQEQLTLSEIDINLIKSKIKTRFWPTHSIWRMFSDKFRYYCRIHMLHTIYIYEAYIVTAKNSIKSLNVGRRQSPKPCVGCNCKMPLRDAKYIKCNCNCGIFQLPEPDESCIIPAGPNPLGLICQQKITTMIMMETQVSLSLYAEQTFSFQLSVAAQLLEFNQVFIFFGIFYLNSLHLRAQLLNLIYNGKADEFSSFQNRTFQV